MITAFSNYFSQFAKLSAKQNLLQGQTDSLLLSVVTLLTRPGEIGNFVQTRYLISMIPNLFPTTQVLRLTFSHCYHSPHIRNIHPLLSEQGRLPVASPLAALCCFLIHCSSKWAAPVPPSPDGWELGESWPEASGKDLPPKEKSRENSQILRWV